jgi:hypothetical protein
MTVGELKVKLEQFPDDLHVLIPCVDGSFEYTSDVNIAQGVNEYDGCLFIDDFVEDYE